MNLTRTVLMSTVALSCTFASATSHAQTQPAFGELRHKTDAINPTKPKTIGAEIRFAPYDPRIRDTREARDVYHQYFGKSGVIDGQPMLNSFELQWFPYDGWGLVGLTATAGFWKASGKAQRCAAPPCDSSGVASGSVDGNTSTSFSVVPIGVGVVYKMDLLQRFFSVPLVVYSKVGFEMYMWWIRAGGKLAKRDFNMNGSEEKGKGASLGMTAAGGLAVNLSWIEPSTASSARASSGLAGTYLFAEVRKIWGDHFGSSRRLDLSDLTIAMGFAFEFE